MFVADKLAKVEILLQQKKFAEAEHILSDLIREEPNNIDILALLAEVNLQQQKLEQANSIIESAIGLSPDAAYLFYIKSRIAIQQENLHEAEDYIQQAIAIDPQDADYYALLANILLSRKQFEAALTMANRALEIDAENLLALNTKSTALYKLNKTEESFATIEGSLRQDPNNTYTHANYGWGLLEKADHKKALEHFKEALAKDPTNVFAQAGLLEAIKASNPLYRAFLKYSFFMSNLTAKYQWGVIIGFYLAFRGLKIVAKNNEALQPYLLPLIITIALIAFSTWVIQPISNLFLRFNQYGQLLLDKKEKMSSNFVAGSLVVFITGLLLYFLLSDEKMLGIAVFGFAMMLPLGSMFTPSKSKYGLIIYTIVLALIGLIAIGFTFATGELLHFASAIFLFGFVAFQWVVNYLLIKNDNPS